MFLKGVSARSIKDSRGENTIEVCVNGCCASAPSGKSTGKHETRPYHKSLDWCVNFLNNWDERVTLDKFEDLDKIEEIISRKLGNARELGANALFAFESAVLKALAKSKKIELWEIIDPMARKMPIPVGNIVGGGLHSHGKNHPMFQEFLIIPQGKSAKDNYEIMKKAHKFVGNKIRAREMNDEGAWETKLSEEKVFEILSGIDKIRLGTDVAASTFYKNFHYNNRTRNEQINYINNLIRKFDLIYVEDPLNEEDFRGFREISKEHLVVGDDLTATQIDRVKMANKVKAINALIVKPNQNGSLLEVKKIVEYCKKNKIKIIFSHRSGETIDDSLADYAFGFGADFIKCGISTRWREAKLKRMIQIERLR